MDIKQNLKATEEPSLSPEAHQELIRYLHRSPNIGRQALSEMIIGEGNSSELAQQLTAEPDLRIPSV